MAFFVFSCTSEGTSSVKRSRTVDYGDLTIYGGASPSGPVKYWEDGQGNEISNKDSLRNILMNKYFKSLPTAERKYIQKISFEFTDGRVTYLDENENNAYLLDILDQDGNFVEKKRINLVVSTYEFKNDSLYIHLDNGNRFFAATRSKIGDTLTIQRGFSYYLTPMDSVVRMDTTGIVDRDIVLGYAGYSSLSDMVTGDTIVYSNAKYKIY